jgi:hypothetical protein
MTRLKSVVILFLYAEPGTCSSTSVCSHYRLACIYHGRGAMLKLACQIDEADGAGKERGRKQIDCAWNNKRHVLPVFATHVVLCAAFDR